MNGNLVGKIVHCNATGHVGFALAFIDTPCYVIQSDDGTRYTLRSDQLHEVPAYDEVEYWKSRAIKAEEKVAR